jgi:hypothetical protein
MRRIPRSNLFRAGVAAAAIAAVAIVLAPDLFHHAPKKSPAAAYIENVDAVEQQMRVPLTRLMTAYRSFATEPASPRTRQKLAAAEQTLRTLESRLSALSAPPVAATLRVLILRLVATELGGAHEVDELADFLPRFTTVAAGAKAAGATLARALAAAQAPKPPAAHGTPQQVAEEASVYAAAVAKAALRQADAIDAYDRSLGRVLQRLRAVKPPPLMAPAYDAQVRTFVETRSAGDALAKELRTKNRTRVAVLTHRLAEAERIAAGVAAQRSEIAAIKAYNARVRAISTLQSHVQSEVSRLQAAGA